MSLKSLIQVIILLLIVIILGGVYFNYFSNYNKVSLQEKDREINSEIVEETSKEKNIIKKKEEEKKVVKTKLEEKKLSEKTEVIEKNIDENNLSEKSNLEVESTNQNLETKEKPKINNPVKDVEYLTTDKNGNKYKILATSGRTNSDDKNVLDLDNVRGIITSNKRSTIYIVSDFAEYNSSSLSSKFYQNVVINYEDKEITCDYFDVDMQTNIAEAYNNVVVTDPKSIMKAGKIILDIETKVIDINPGSKKTKVTVKTY